MLAVFGFGKAAPCGPWVLAHPVCAFVGEGSLGKLLGSAVRPHPLGLELYYM